MIMVWSCLLLSLVCVQLQQASNGKSNGVAMPGDSNNSEAFELRGECEPKAASCSRPLSTAIPWSI